MMFSEKLNELINAKGWTSAHLAVALCDMQYPVTVAGVDRWRDGSRNPRYEAIPYIARVFGVDAADLFAEVPTPAES
jgi:transcriptional regulator with XRE-family HTH domain